MQFANTDLVNNKRNDIMTVIKFKLTLKNMAILVGLCIFLKFYVLIKGSPLNTTSVKKRELLKVQLEGEDLDDSRDPDFEKFERANKVMHGPKFVNPVNVEKGRGGGGDLRRKRAVDSNKSMNKTKIKKKDTFNDVEKVDKLEGLEKDDNIKKGQGYELKNHKEEFLNQKQKNKRARKEANKVKKDKDIDDDDDKIKIRKADDHQQKNENLEQGNNVNKNKKVNLINKQQDEIKEKINEERDIKGDKYMDNKINVEEKQIFVKDGRNWEMINKDDNGDSNGKEAEDKNYYKNVNGRLEGKKENVEPENPKLEAKHENKLLEHENIRLEANGNIKHGKKSGKDKINQHEDRNENQNKKDGKIEKVKPQVIHEKKAEKRGQRDFELKNNIKNREDLQKNEQFIVEMKDNITNNKDSKAKNQDPFKLEGKKERANVNYINLVNERINEIDINDNDILDKIEGPEDGNLNDDEEVLESLNENNKEIVLEHQMAGRQKDRAQIKSVLNNPKKKEGLEQGKNRIKNKNKNGNLRKRIGLDSLQRNEAKKKNI